MIWQGRQLTQTKKNGTTIKYTYGADGLRASKTVGCTKQTFQYVGRKLMYENRGNGIELYYSYDSFGNLSCIRYHNNGSYNTYYAVCNIRGDVEALYNGTGKRIAKYAYDTWGNTISVVSSTRVEITNESSIGLVNRIRYRGYYWDAETSLYYVGSRYYDPEVCRFINADEQIPDIGGDIRGYNLYAYCFNNPVNMSDSSENWPQWVKSAANWVNNNIFHPIKEIFTPYKHTNLVNLSSHGANRRPIRGEPGSTYRAPNGDTRTNGSNGEPVHDYEHNNHGYTNKHPHDENGGHNYDWVNGVRGPAYSINWQPIVGVALVTISVIGIIAVAADDLTGIGMGDDFLFGPLGAGVREGLIMIFG